MTAAAQKNYKHLANAVAVVHAVWLTAILASLPLSLKWKWYRKVAATAALATAGSWIVWGDCPLYELENSLRKKSDPAGMYGGSFTGHYLHKFFSIDIPAKVFTAIGYSYAAVITVLSLLENSKKSTSNKYKAKN